MNVGKSVNMASPEQTDFENLQMAIYFATLILTHF